jgi:hydroxymethylglutaryl-CoA lyase
VLIPNRRGLELALEHDVRNVLYTIGATETFNRRNVNRSVAQSLDDLDLVVGDARTVGAAVDVAVSVAFGCPFEGLVDAQRVVDLCAELVRRGAAEVGIADTIGVAHPAAVRELCARAGDVVPDGRLSLHVHDTRGLGVANVLVAYEAGVTRFDGSAGGLGGCPFAPRSTGNVCSEDALQAVASAGGVHGCDLVAYCGVSDVLAADLGMELPGKLYRAGVWTGAAVEEPVA